MLLPAGILTIEHESDESIGGPTGIGPPLSVGQARGGMWIRFILWIAARRLSDLSDRHLGQPNSSIRGESCRRETRPIPARDVKVPGAPRRYVWGAHGVR
ncbi:MAG: hypothetical protein KAV00_14345, partial [Phycisphaerae bacterium]|nr:hypothetical protein [Phycisphaerae bacterium]